MGQHDTTSDERMGGDLLSERIERSGTHSVLKRPLENISYEEQLLIHRRRKGLNQQNMAKLLGVSRKTYSKLERGENTERKPDAPSVEPLKSHEQCLLIRKRCGWSQKRCADLAGISSYWFRLMELGQAGHEKLVDFWNEHEG